LRAAVGALLLLWAFHSIFVNEAREQARRGELVDAGRSVDWSAQDRAGQWRLGWRHGPPALWKNLRAIQPAPFALSLVLMGGTLALGIVRWRMVLQVPRFDLPFRRVAEISLVAHFFNGFLLGTAGGDVMKAYCAARETNHKKTEAVVTVFVDRVLGLWAMLLFASLMILPNVPLFARTGLATALRQVPGQPVEGLRAVWAVIWQEPIVTAAALLVAMTAAASGFVFLAFRGGVSKRVSNAREWLRRLPKGDWLERSLDSCREYGRRRGFVSRALLLSMALNFLCVLQFWVLARGLGMDVPLLALCLIVPTVVCISALPISAGGLGVRENLFVQLLAAQTIGAHPTESLSLSLLAFSGSLFWSLIGGVVYVLFKHKHHLAPAEPGSQNDR
jgi:uncharacterized membrane protein YbhN (UPF0104 family)